MSDSEIRTLINIGKEELRARLGNEQFVFYEAETHSADRALFWFTCIATKVKAGEIAGINITVDQIEASTSSIGQYDYWFESFRERLSEAETQAGATIAQTQMERDNRTYGDNA